METKSYYDKYPLWIVFTSNLLSFSIYIISAFIIYKIGLIWLVIYLCYILFLEIKLWKKSCVDCYYYGKTCAFGRGKISGLFFKKGDPGRFSCRKLEWKDLIPDLLVSAVPAIACIILLVINFNWPLLALLIILILLSSFGNGFVRGSLACRYCRQRELGCPAEELFDKGKK